MLHHYESDCHAKKGAIFQVRVTVRAHIKCDCVPYISRGSDLILFYRNLVWWYIIIAEAFVKETGWLGLGAAVAAEVPNVSECSSNLNVRPN